MHKRVGLFLRIFLVGIFLIIGCSKIEPRKDQDGKGYIRRPYGVLSRENRDLPPVVDREDEPFDWYRNPKCVIGVMGGPEETLVTEEGYLRTDFGTLKFYTGENLDPINKRVKTWKEGYLPILQMEIKRDNLNYRFEFFADTVKGITRVPYTHSFGVPGRELKTDIANLVNFAKIEIMNNSDFERKVNFGVGLGPVNIGPPSKQGSERPSKMSFDLGLKALIGEGKVLYMVSLQPDTVIGSRREDEGVVKYEFMIEPGKSKKIIVKMPYFIAKKEVLSTLKEANYEDHLKRTVNFWKEIFNKKATLLQVPEEKVVNAYKANIIFSLIGCLDIVDGYYFYHANATCYDAFWLRDAALNLRGLEIAGFNEIVKKVLLTSYLYWQNKEGEFVGRHPEEWDGHGQAMWALGHHYLMTRDKDYAEKVFPSVLKAMKWQWKFRKEAWDKSKGLYPYLHMADNEGVRGFLVGYNLWAISGAKGATWIAKGLNREDLAREWESRYLEYEKILKERCKEVFLQLGVVPPALEGLEAPAIIEGWYGDKYGIDWGNLMLVYPSRVFDPFGKMVEGSLKEWRKKTFEGIFTYPINGVESILHSYTPLYISETYTIRGDQWEATRDLYNHLVHTSATHMASEGMNAAARWGWDPETHTMPHGEFSGKYLSLIRDMLILEWNGSLHIGKVLSPAWLKKGSTIKFNGPTYFGKTSFKIDVLGSRMILTLKPPTRNPPKNIVIHLPWNVETVGVKKDGKPWKNFTKDEVILPPLEKRTMVEIKWKKVGDAPALSFERAVKDYKANYNKMVKEPEITLVGSLEVSTTEVEANEPFTISATIENTGGAGWVDEDIKLFIDDVPIKSNPKELSRGIGFNSPRGIISFRKNEGGKLPVSFTAKHTPGPHKVTIGIGKGNKLPPKVVTVKQFRP